LWGVNKKLGFYDFASLFRDGRVYIIFQRWKFRNPWRFYILT